jgi:hypothetical protein
MHQFTLSNPDQIRGDQLVDEIFQATGVDVEGSYGFEPPATVTIALDLTAGQVSDIGAVIAGHVRDPLYFEADRERQAREDRLASDRATWLASQLANKTPAEVHQIVEGRAQSATTVAEMRQVLLDLLPAIAAGLAVVAHRTVELE